MRASRVIYIEEPNDMQVSWAACQDPRDVLTVGEVYEVDAWEPHSWHTKIHLVGFPGRGFNSVSFKEA